MSDSPTSFPDISRLAVAVIVLYRTAPADSAALRTFAALLSQMPFARGSISCVLYDNGPVRQTVPVESFPVVYHHDASNPGLARAYDFALKLAEHHGVPWLLLLDQDTHLTATYLNEALEQAAQLRNSIGAVAIAPKLMQGDLLLSPHWPPRYPSSTLLSDRHGLIEPPLQVFNSGAWIRVSALTAIGGFPEAFPLDYLDHAVFTQLQRTGGKVYLLHAELQHDLAALQLDLVKEFGRVPRLESILRAESRFYRAYGTIRDRCIYTLRRSKLVIRMLAAGNMRGVLLLLRCTFNPG